MSDTPARIIGRRVERHTVIGSTNDRARELAASGEPEGTVVVADEQTRGRGRFSRAWHSAPGVGLYMSVIIRPQAPPARAPIFGLLAAVAAASALGRLLPVAPGIKWPNDVVVEDPGAGPRRKLAGILTEARTAPDRIRDLVIGFGVNVNHGSGDFPVDISARATSLRILCGRTLDRSVVATEILTALDDWYTLWTRDGEGPVLEAFREFAHDLDGRRVRVVGGHATWEGTTAGLSSDGALRVHADGASRPTDVHYGDVLRVEEG